MPATCFCAACVWTKDSGWGKKSKREQHFVTCERTWNQVSVATDRACLLTDTMSVTASPTATRQTEWAPAEKFWPTKPQMFTIRPFTEKGCWPSPTGTWLPKIGPSWALVQAPQADLQERGWDPWLAGCLDADAGVSSLQIPRPPCKFLLLLIFTADMATHCMRPTCSGGRSPLRAPWPWLPAPPGDASVTQATSNRGRGPEEGHWPSIVISHREIQLQGAQTKTQSYVSTSMRRVRL